MTTETLARDLQEALGIDLPDLATLAEMDPPLATEFLGMARAVRRDNALAVKDQALIYIALYASLAQLNAPLTRAYIRAALKAGAHPGEIMFRGNGVMKGYYKNPEATEEAFAGGFFHSGDVAVQHPDGYVQITDRAKDVIISGGENISSVEVEGVLMAHPSVSLCAVVAKPDEKWGEVPCAFVELIEGHPATEAELIGWCRERLAGFKTPKKVVFADLPKTSTGKIQKFELRGRAKAL